MFNKVLKALREGGVTLIARRLINKVRWSLVWQDYTRHASHHMVEAWPETDVVFQGPQQSTADAEIAQRVVMALRLALKDEQKEWTGDLWDRIQDERHADFFRIWDDPEKVAEYMNNMNERGITHGLGGGSTGRKALEDTRVRKSWGVMMKDILVSFAEATGALPLKQESNLYLEESKVLALLEEKLGIFLSSPEIDGGQYKFQVAGRKFDMKELWSAYTAWRACELVGRNASIAEIGGGTGKAALYSKRFGFKSYSIFDLPIVNVVQAWYLIKSGVEVTLYGEPEIPSSVRVMPYWAFTGKQKYDLVINVDSFAEMDESVVKGYLEAIRQIAPKYLLSINQEEEGEYGDGHRHTVVQNVMDKVGGFKRLVRFPFWLSGRYVEELYAID